MSAELDPKRLQLLHEIATSVSWMAFLVNPNLTPGLRERFAGAEAAAKSLGIAMRRADAATPPELTTDLAATEASSSEALLVQNDPMLGNERSRIFWTLPSRTGCRQFSRPSQFSGWASCSPADPT
jgi:hypothetical protein